MNFHVIGNYLAMSLRYQRLALVASFILVATPSHASENLPEVYAGTVGSARVVIELEGGVDEEADTVSGRYFYRKYRLDIGLRGTRTGDGLLLDSPTSGDRMTLHSTDNGLSGLLTTKDARRFAVSLSPIGANAADTDQINDSLTGFSSYEREQIAELAFVAGDIRQVGTGILRNWREAVSGVEMFRVETGYSVAVLDTINATLERQHWERVSQWFTCEGYGGEPGIEISEARAPFLSDEFVSYAWFANWSCAGAAHPDFGTVGHTFDGRTGREMALEDLIYFGDVPIPQKDSAEFYAYRNEVFAPRIVALLGELYPQEMKPAGDETAVGDCDYSDAAVWDFPSWYLTPQGIYLGAYFGRAQRSCDNPEWSVIPWQILAQLKPVVTANDAVNRRADALYFGQLALDKNDIVRLSQEFDDRGIPVIGVALQTDATKELEAETTRLLNTDVTIALGSSPLISARLVEPITEGRFHISGRFRISEAQAMAGQIICALRLSPDQYDPPSLARNLPCKPGSTEGSKP